MPPPPKYTLDQRAAFLNAAGEMQKRGMSKRKIAELLGVNAASLSGWMREETLDRLYPRKPYLLPRNRIQAATGSSLMQRHGQP